MSHYCKRHTPSGAYGEAISECWEAPRFGQETDPELFPAGQFWVGNGEYWSAVDFCPFCGMRALVAAGVAKSNAGIAVVKDSPATAQTSGDLNK